MSDFYKRLDDKEADERLNRIFANRPDNLHDYQGCVNDPSMKPTAERQEECKCRFLTSMCDVCQEKRAHPKTVERQEVPLPMMRQVPGGAHTPASFVERQEVKTDDEMLIVVEQGEKFSFREARLWENLVEHCAVIHTKKPTPQVWLKSTNYVGKLLVRALDSAQTRISSLEGEIAKQKIETANILKIGQNEVAKRDKTISLLQETQANHNWWVERAGQLEAENAALTHEHEILQRISLEQRGALTVQIAALKAKGSFDEGVEVPEPLVKDEHLSIIVKLSQQMGNSFPGFGSPDDEYKMALELQQYRALKRGE